MSSASLVFSGGIGQTGVRNFNKTGPGTVRFGACGRQHLHRHDQRGVRHPRTAAQRAAPPPSADRSSSGKACRRRTPQPSCCWRSIRSRTRRTSPSAATACSRSAVSPTPSPPSRSPTERRSLGPAGDLVVSGLSMSGGTVILGDAGSTFTLQGNVTATSSTLNQSTHRQHWRRHVFAVGRRSHVHRRTTAPPGNDLVINAPIIGTGCRDADQRRRGRDGDGRRLREHLCSASRPCATDAST